MDFNDLYAPRSSVSRETSCHLISKFQRVEEAEWSAFNLLINAAMKVEPHNKKTPTPEQVLKRKENARKHYEKNKEKRREQMKFYQRERRTNPAVRLLHNERERLRLRERREADRTAKYKINPCAENGKRFEFDVQVDEELLAQMA